MEANKQMIFYYAFSAINSEIQMIVSMYGKHATQSAAYLGFQGGGQIFAGH